tara:strand:- start:368 stop:1186 length:819 start_codon:yes stop_codon:yes gene_type:complete
VINQYYTPGMSPGGSPSYEKAKREFDKRTGRADASGRDDQGADLDMDAIRRLSRNPENQAAMDSLAAESRERLAADLGEQQVVQPSMMLSDDANSRQSALDAMRQQYAPSTGIYDTDAGKAMLAMARQNQLSGEGNLADYYGAQQKVGAGLSDEVISAMGYEGPMAEWAKANPALAMREYNKKFANSYEGTGPGDEAIQQAMDQGQFFPSQGSPNPLGTTGQPREANTQATSGMQNTMSQKAAEAGLQGKSMLMALLNKMEADNMKRMGAQR